MKDHSILTNWARKNLKLVNIDGYDLVINDNDKIMLPKLKKDHVWEPKATQELKQRLHANNVFVDVGAHWGYYTFMASRIVGEGGSVYAFEPLIANYTHLIMGVMVNNATNVCALNLGLWKEATILPFISDEPLGNTGAGHILRYGDEVSNVEYHHCIRLDDMFQPGDIDFLKIDAEENDEEVILGALKILQEGHAQLMIEKPPVKLLRMLGYSAVVRFRDERVWFFEKNSKTQESSFEEAIIEES